jgi:SAM-dependent methyltransferase
MNYKAYYRLGITPWEQYAEAASDGIREVLDREEDDRGEPLGRALDLGCGRGVFTAELARRGWDVVGLDLVPQAIEQAEAASIAGAKFVVGDVTALESAGLGAFDFFLDIGCFQGLDAEQRAAYGQGVTALATPGSSLLMLEFGPTRLRSMIGGVSEAEVRAALPDWELRSVAPAPTKGLGWPMNRTKPQWFRFTRTR